MPVVRCFSGAVPAGTRSSGSQRPVGRASRGASLPRIVSSGLRVGAVSARSPLEAPGTTIAAVEGDGERGPGRDGVVDAGLGGASRVASIGSVGSVGSIRGGGGTGARVMISTGVVGGSTRSAAGAAGRAATHRTAEA